MHLLKSSLKRRFIDTLSKEYSTQMNPRPKFSRKCLSLFGVPCANIQYSCCDDHLEHFHLHHFQTTSPDRNCRLHRLTTCRHFPHSLYSWHRIKNDDVSDEKSDASEMSCLLKLGSINHCSSLLTSFRATCLFPRNTYISSALVLLFMLEAL